ncbi:MAG: pyridoxamine 5'-phosphate oxidase family protein [Acidobacteria bacterium]|nr:pyridoxamine 5'-phosphate oxidase family protein [Acidobacteriota bacterium]
MAIPRRALRLSPAELDELLAAERTVRAATVSPDGMPHVAPLWFVWHAGAIWVNSLIRSRRTRDVGAGSPVALCVDSGEHYGELRGAVLYGRFEEAAGDPYLPGAQAVFAARYWGGAEVPALRSHAWVKLVPGRIVSWDFGKIAADRRLEASRPAEGSPGKP